MIVPMKHISLFVLKRDEQRIMKALQRAGAVQLSTAAELVAAEAEEKAEAEAANTAAEPSALPADIELAEEAAEGQITEAAAKTEAKVRSEDRRPVADPEAYTGFLRSCEEELAQKQLSVQRIKSALGALASYAPKEGMSAKLAPDPEFDEEELTGSIAPSLEVCERLDELTHELAVIRQEREKHQSAIKQLKPFAAMDIKAEDIVSTKNADFLTGLISAAELPALAEAGVAFDAFGVDGKVPIIVAVPKSAPEETEALLKKTGFQEKILPEITGTPAENIASLTAKSEELDKRQAEAKQRMQQLGDSTELLKKGFDGAMIEQQRAKARCDLFATRETVLLTGWVRSDEESKLRETVENTLDVYYLDLRDPYDDEQPPTYCKNSKFFAPFETITNMYSPPDPRGFDPTVVMTPFYLLFFGLMMGDTGYGILMSVAAALFYKIKKPRGGVGNICQILIWGGISTAIFGLLAGTCFGMNWYDIFGPNFPFPLLDPMKDQMTALIVYCGLGFGQIIAGMIVSIVLHLKQGDWQTALYDIGSWLMIFAGAALALLLKAPAKYAGFGLLGLGLILLVGFGGRAKKGVGRVIGGLGKLYDITGFLSDVLSYSRVFALGLATGAMGSAFNLVANIAKDMLKGIPVVGGVVSFVVAAVLLVVLHVFCVAINALGAFIHCARLQFIEYYNRFYTPGGHLFAPLGMYTKHNRIK